MSDHFACDPASRLFRNQEQCNAWPGTDAVCLQFWQCLRSRSMVTGSLSPGMVDQSSYVDPEHLVKADPPHYHWPSPSHAEASLAISPWCKVPLLPSFFLYPGTPPAQKSVNVPVIPQKLPVGLLIQLYDTYVVCIRLYMFWLRYP